MRCSRWSAIARSGYGMGSSEHVWGGWEMVAVVETLYVIDAAESCVEKVVYTPWRCLVCQSAALCLWPAPTPRSFLYSER